MSPDRRPDAAHELGSPLTVLRGEIELALRRERTSEDYRAALTICGHEAGNLSKLAAHLLLLASADAGQPLLAPADLDLAALCREVAARWQPCAAVAGLALTCDVPPSAPISGDTAALERILNNLLENAVRHTPHGGRVAISLGKKDAAAVLRVTDSGAGIAAAHVPRLFERFYRVDVARSRAQGGAGLGLAIVKALVEAHGASLTVTSELGAGTSFELNFPTAGRAHFMEAKLTQM